MLKTPMDTDLFRSLAINHQAVLSIAMTLADNNDARTMRELLPVFAGEMKGSKFYKDNAFGSVELNGGQGGRPFTFNQAFVQVLRPVVDAEGKPQNTWNREQEAFFQEVWPIVQRNPASLHDFLVDAAKNVQDPRYLQLHDRLNTDTTQRMMLAACAGGCMAALHDMAEHLPASALGEFAKKMLPGHDYVDGDIDGIKGLANTFEASSEGRRQVIALMDRFKGDDSNDSWRQEFFHRQMALFDKQGEPWSMQALAEVAGVMDESGVTEAVRRWSRAHLDKYGPELVARALNQGSFSFSECVNQTLRAHCAPVTDAMGDVFRAVGVDAQAMPYVFRGPMRSVDAYKGTLLALQTHGHDLNGTPPGPEKRGYIPALKFLSQEPNTEDRDAKLAVLLDLGAKPTDEITKGIKDTPSRNRWKSVIASHSARKAAHSLIDEMNLDDAKAPAP